MMRLIVLCATLAVTYGAFTGDEKAALILRSEQDISPEGAYNYALETENGIIAEAVGTLKQVGDATVVGATGRFSYLSPEGEQIQLEYVADENGFQPLGSHLPTPPPIPVAIAKSLEYIAAHPPVAAST